MAEGYGISASDRDLAVVGGFLIVSVVVIYLIVKNATDSLEKGLLNLPEKVVDSAVCAVKAAGTAIEQPFQSVLNWLDGSTGGASTCANADMGGVDFGVTNSGWCDPAHWNASAVPRRAARQGKPAPYAAYALQHATKNPYAAGYSGPGYTAARTRGGVPLELQPNPLTTGAVKRPKKAA